MASKPVNNTIHQSVNTTTLDDLLSAAEDMYGSYDVTDFNVKLRPLLRLTKAEREELQRVTNTEEDEDGNTPDFLDILQAWVRIVADNKVGAEKLIEAIGDRLDVFKVLQDRWSEKSQSGEAQPSES